MPTKSKTNSQTLKFVKEELNHTLSYLRIEPIKNEQYFIPEVICINGIRTASVPFNCNEGKSLFMGDVIKVTFHDMANAVYLVDLIDGQYVCTSLNQNEIEPLFMFDSEMITNLGSSIAYPQLLNKLSA